MLHHQVKSPQLSKQYDFSQQYQTKQTTSSSRNIKSFTKNNQVPKATFSQFIQELIYSHENGKGRTIHLNKLCKVTSIEKRRLSDLFSALCSMDVCSKICSQCFRWNSMKNIDGAICRIARNLEEHSIMNFQNIHEIFDANQSPSVGELSVKLVEVFLYFGETEMSLSVISKLLSPKPEKIKQVLRRIYLAAYFLEQFNVLSHGSKRGMYIFVPDMNEISIRVLTDISHEINLKVNSYFNNSYQGNVSNINSENISRPSLNSNSNSSSPSSPEVITQSNYSCAGNLSNDNYIKDESEDEIQQDKPSSISRSNLFHSISTASVPMLLVSPSTSLLPLMNHIDLTFLNALRAQRRNYMQFFFKNNHRMDFNDYSNGQFDSIDPQMNL